jgi:hypothetical protein
VAGVEVKDHRRRVGEARVENKTGAVPRGAKREIKMKPIDGINLRQLVDEQDAQMRKEKRDRVAKLVREKLERRERLNEQLGQIQEDLRCINATLEKIGAGDWTEIDWKPDSAEG